MELLLNKTNLSKRNVIKNNAGLSRCLYFLLRTTLRKKVKGQPSFHFNVSLRSQCNKSYRYFSNSLEQTKVQQF